MNNKKGLVEIVAISLILVVTVVAFIGFQGWFQTLQGGLITDMEIETYQSISRSKIESVIGDTLYVRTDRVLNYTSIRINGIDCNLNGTIISGVNSINISECINQISIPNPEIVIVTDKGIISRNVNIKASMLTEPYIQADTFISVWNTSFAGSASNQIELPLESTGTYNFSIVSNGTFTQTGTSNITITEYNQRLLNFTEPGVYELNITGEIVGFRFNNDGDRLKIIEIKQWGPLRLGNNGAYFHGGQNLIISAIDPLDLTGTNNLSYMFYYWGVEENKFNITGNINNWDVSNVIDMTGMFAGATNFNQNLNNWDVSSVTSMNSMFANCDNFNGDISNWDTSNVEDMIYMFGYNYDFNVDITNWNTSNVRYMWGMFYGASSFNQPIGSWDTRNVESIGWMFRQAFSFNQNLSSWNTSNIWDMDRVFSKHNTDVEVMQFNGDLSGWDTRNVETMDGIFYGAGNFNGDISNWNTSNVENMREVFRRAYNFNHDIGNWDVRSVTNMVGMFRDATSFNQDLRKWCVRDISPEPSNFATSSPLNTNGMKPLWGSCPVIPGAFTLIMDPTLGTDGTSSTQVRIPAGTGTFNYNISWTQGSSTGNITDLTGSHTINLPSSGIVYVNIIGQFPHWQSEGDWETPINHGIVDVIQWGDIQWESMTHMFLGEENLVSFSATDSPDLRNVNSMHDMFLDAILFNDNLNSWDVSNVTNMMGMFFNAHSFNGNISNWDVSNVYHMGWMFRDAWSFNQDISGWDMSNVNTTHTMFYNATSFNIDIGNWNVSNIETMFGMFWHTNFNQDISGWNTSKVETMRSMFQDAGSFNQNLSSWNVSLVTNCVNFNNGASSWSLPKPGLPGGCLS